MARNNSNQAISAWERQTGERGRPCVYHVSNSEVKRLLARDPDVQTLSKDSGSWNTHKQTVRTTAIRSRRTTNGVTTIRRRTA